MSVADDDVSVAVLAKWNQDAALAAIPIARGRLTASVTSQPVYAGLEVKQGPTANEIISGPAYLDYRTVTITLRGLEFDVRTALAQVGAVFDWTTLDVPNAAFGRIMPLGARHIEQDPATKLGTDIWQGIAEYEVMTTRSYG